MHVTYVCVRYAGAISKIFACMHVYLHVYILACVSMHACMHAYTCMHAWLYRICMGAKIYTVDVCVCMRVCMYDSFAFV